MAERPEGPSSPKKARGKEKQEIIEKARTTKLDSSFVGWMKEIKDKMRNLRELASVEEATRITNEGQKTSSVFRVPTGPLGRNPEHYQPKVVAIGPYHRCNATLPIKDKDKWHCANYFVSKGSLDLKKWLPEMTSREQEARNYYSEDISNMDSKSFIEMLLLDGCFILQAFESTGARSVSMEHPLEQIILDFLLVGNQIPFFVLIQLYGSAYQEELVEVIYHFFWDNLRLWEYIRNPSANPNQIVHLLHLFHLFLVRVEDEPTDIIRRHVRATQLPSATELHYHSAVKFQTISTLKMLNIKFRNGVMEIPILEMYDDTSTLLRNLIAFEQCYSRISPHLTDYAVFMDCLINNETDVRLLEKNGILSNGLPTRKDAAHFFSELGLRDKVRSEYLNDVIEDVNRYHNKKWHRWYADALGGVRCFAPHFQLYANLLYCHHLLS